MPHEHQERPIPGRLHGPDDADYELHCGVIAECRQRTPMAEAVQREPGRRYAIAAALA